MNAVVEVDERDLTRLEEVGLADANIDKYDKNAIINNSNVDRIGVASTAGPTEGPDVPGRVCGSLWGDEVHSSAPDFFGLMAWSAPRGGTPSSIRSTSRGASYIASAGDGDGVCSHPPQGTLAASSVTRSNSCAPALLEPQQKDALCFASLPA